MGKAAANLLRVWLDQYDLSGYLTGGNQNIAVPLADARCLSDEGPVKIIGGVPDHTHDSAGLYDRDAAPLTLASHDLKLWTPLMSDTDHYLAKLFEGSVRGGRVSEAVVRLDGMPWGAQMGSAQTLGFSASGSDGIGHGSVLEPYSTITGAGNRTGVNQGATLLGTYYAVTFRVFGGVFTSFTLHIEESTDDGVGDAYADIASLASGSITGPCVVRVVIATATHAWKRLVIGNWNGTSAIIAATGVIVPHI